LAPESGAKKRKPNRLAEPYAIGKSISVQVDRLRKLRGRFDRLQNRLGAKTAYPSRGLPIRPNNVSRSATADFDAPLTAVAAQVFQRPSDQCGATSSFATIVSERLFLRSTLLQASRHGTLENLTVNGH
jgi:hypothetical protein